MEQEVLHLEIALIGQLAAKDQSALSVLYDRWNRLVYALILRLVQDKEAAEELTQECFLKIWNQAHTYQSQLGQPRTWAVRIARNLAIDRLRSRAHKQQQLQVGSGEDILKNISLNDNPENTLLRTEKVMRLEAALEHLPVEQRILIERAYYEGRSQSELAGDFDLPLGTVKTRMRTALIHLREHFKTPP